MSLPYQYILFATKISAQSWFRFMSSLPARWTRYKTEMKAKMTTFISSNTHNSVGCFYLFQFLTSEPLVFSKINMRRGDIFTLFLSPAGGLNPARLYPYGIPNLRTILKLIFDLIFSYGETNKMTFKKDFHWSADSM